MVRIVLHHSTSRLKPSQESIQFCQFRFLARSHDVRPKFGSYLSSEASIPLEAGRPTPEPARESKQEVTSQQEEKSLTCLPGDP
jgi:hypothetical protein